MDTRLKRFMISARAGVSRAWCLLRRLSGDDAYERYLHHCRSHHPTMRPLDKAAYFKFEQERRWNGIRRCC